MEGVKPTLFRHTSRETVDFCCHLKSICLLPQMKSCTQTAPNTTKRVLSASPVENSLTFFHSSIVLIVFPRQSAVQCFGRSLFWRNTHHFRRSNSDAETQVTICVDSKYKFTPLQFWKLICWRLQFPPPMFCFVFSNGLLKWRAGECVWVERGVLVTQSSVIKRELILMQSGDKFILCEPARRALATRLGFSV